MTRQILKSLHTGYFKLNMKEVCSFIFYERTQFFHKKWLSSFIYEKTQTSSKNPPKKCLIYGILLFFHMFFAISFPVRSNTYSKVMILYPKDNSMLLNRFLTLFWLKNHFCVLSATRYENWSLKNRKKSPRIWGDFWRFFSEQFSYLVAENTQE